MSFVNTWGGETYIETVKDVVDSDNLSDFKSRKEYKTILEHASQQEASFYYTLIMDRIKNGEVINNELINKFKENDKLGNGETINCEYFGEIGRSTLKYIALAYQIRDLVGEKKNLKLLEIGGGYGGQVKILCDLLDVSEVFMIDIPVVLSLQKKYLQHHGIEVNTVDPDKVESLYDKEFDLVVSNHAICELHRDLQDTYIPLVKNSKNGYILYHHSETWGGSYSMKDFCDKIDRPPTGRDFWDSPSIEW
jgi:putative sugar O-methyltransferase